MCTANGTERIENIVHIQKQAEVLNGIKLLLSILLTSKRNVAVAYRGAENEWSVE